MPLHLYYVPKGLYTAQDKEEIAAAVTKVYSVLPDFYVVVLFITLDPEDYFVGAKKTNQFVRIVIQHIARQFSDDAAKRGFMDRYEAAIAPWTKGRNLDWEIQVEVADRVTWNENGMSPPLPNTEEEKLWKAQNKAVPYDDSKNFQTN